ncbi:KtrAB potassium uptake system, integral membrane component KtrB [Brevinematales bacterium NS]|nr:KtrAB potassium uptake system, integral membrane component KtrB [Brevinematales bacterium NS]
MVRLLRWFWVACWGGLLVWAFWRRELSSIHFFWQGLVWGLVGLELIGLVKKERYVAFSSLVFLLWTLFVYLIYGKPGGGIEKSFLTNGDTYNLLVVLTISFWVIWLFRNSGLLRWISRMGWQPYMVIVFSFVVLIWIGTVLLMFPFSQSVRGQVSFLDALFTATSAVCVTGLTVLDTGRDFSLAGQLVILGLIQFGGLGLMVFAGAFAFMMGRGLSLQSGATLTSALGVPSFREVRHMIKSILLFTLWWEFVGTVLLFLAFSKEFPWFQALYYGLFHSVSAFCNAGFSLFSDNLVGFRGNTLVLLTVAFLIIFGGLGFSVMRNLWWFFRRSLRMKNKRKRKENVSSAEEEKIRMMENEGYLRLHSRIVLGMTVFLIMVGMVGILMFEYNGQLAGLSFSEKVLNAFFSSVTARTAGFNTIDYGKAQPITLFLTMILMFIGASPGSTGGGIKTTTAFLIFLNTYHVLRETLRVSVGERDVPFENIRKAYLIFVMSLLWVLLAFGVLLVFQGGVFERLLFEVISAFGTVGLSTGITSSLSSPAKVVLIFTMFFGRVGPLALFYGIGISAQRVFVRYIQEDVMVG